MELRNNSLGLVYGRSGSGKTTLLQLLSGLRDHTRGSICMVKPDGASIELTASARQAGCGLVFQFPERHFLGTNLVTELFLAAPPGGSPAAAAARAAFTQRLPGVLQAVGMQAMPLNTDPSTLSDGYKRRLALAVQLLRQPDLLLLDEPLAGLDWRARKELVALLQSLKKRLSLLVISHDLRELAPIVDTAWEMHVGGRLEHKGRNFPVGNISSRS